MLPLWRSATLVSLHALRHSPEYDGLLGARMLGDSRWRRLMVYTV